MKFTTTTIVLVVLIFSMSLLAQPDQPTSSVVPGENSTAPAAETVQVGPEKLVDIQSMLNWMGYDVGKPDGKMGPQTRREIKAFQRNLGLDTSGEASTELYAVISPHYNYRECVMAVLDELRSRTGASIICGWTGTGSFKTIIDNGGSRYTYSNTEEEALILIENLIERENVSADSSLVRITCGKPPLWPAGSSPFPEANQ